ncbi:MAG TPA: molybdenum cofactor guanylyltransferase [Gaiellaceae bacterium]
MAHRELTGVLLVGGASTRFGSPKALARIDGATLAERAWRVLGEACAERIAVGKLADGLELPFELLDDGSDVRAPIAGLVAGLRAATHELVAVIPVDLPLLTRASLEALAARCRDAAIPSSGPLPGVYRTSVLPTFERALAAGEYRLRDVLDELDVAVVELDETELVNVNEPADLERLTNGTV